MDNQFSLAQALLSGMGQKQQPQQLPPQQPQGGLAQAGIPQMSKQGTDMALAAENREEVVEPGLNQASQMGFAQYSRDLMDRLQQTLPSQDAMRRAQAARGLLMGNALETMAPKEYSGMDIATAGITSHNKPIMQGDLGSSLATMGQGTRRAQTQFEDTERQKALGAYGLVDKEIDQQQKIISDGITKSNKLALTGMGSSGKWIPSPKEPGVFVNNVTGERKVMSNTDAIQIRELTGKLLSSGKFDTPQEAMDAAIQLHHSMMPQGAAAPGRPPMGMAPPNNSQGVPMPPPMAQIPPQSPQMPPPQAIQARPEVGMPAPSTPQNAPAPFAADVSGPEGFEILRSWMNKASKAGDRESFNKLLAEMQKQFPNGRPEGTIPTSNQGNWPSTTVQKAETKSATNFTVTPQEAFLQGVPYIPSIYDKYTDPKRREEALDKYTKDWQEWQKAKAPEFQAAGELEQGLKRFSELQQHNKGTDAGVYDALPFVTDIRARMNPSLQEMQTITNKQAIKMREAGSGAMSDKDLATFKQSVVGVDKQPETNTSIINAQLAGIQRIKDFKRFSSKMFEVYRYVDPSKIESMWQEYTDANPIYGGIDKKTGQVIINKTVPFERWFNQNRKD